MKKIRVMIVEDSPVVSALLEHTITSDERLEVCSTVSDAEDALRQLERVLPDVIAMDIRLPRMDGLEATRQIMSRRPVPIVVVAASRESGKWNTVAIQALQAGALAVLEKPLGITSADYATLSGRLCTQLAIMSQVKLVRRRGAGPCCERNGYFGTPRDGSAREFTMLGIVCSTGGPAALVRLLGGLGASFPLPILLVQHMTPNFLEGFAAWLQDVCPFRVALVDDCCVPQAGVLHMAAAERHLRLRGRLLRLDAGDPVSYQRPSGTVLFESMARDLGARALGVLLTGMGDDGASGLLDIRRNGGYTIAEDESTAVMYGMPGAAATIGAVCESLPLPAIAGRVLELVSCEVREREEN